MVVQVVYYYILTEKQTRHAIEIADYQQQVAIQQEKQREEKMVVVVPKFNPIF